MQHRPLMFGCYFWFGMVAHINHLTSSDRCYLSTCSKTLVKNHFRWQKLNTNAFPDPKKHASSLKNANPFRMPEIITPWGLWILLSWSANTRATSVVLSSTNRNTTAQAMMNWYAVAVTLGATCGRSGPSNKKGFSLWLQLRYPTNQWYGLYNHISYWVTNDRLTIDIGLPMIWLLIYKLWPSNISIAYIIIDHKSWGLPSGPGAGEAPTCGSHLDRSQSERHSAAETIDDIEWPTHQMTSTDIRCHGLQIDHLTNLQTKPYPTITWELVSRSVES